MNCPRCGSQSARHLVAVAPGTAFGSSESPHGKFIAGISCIACGYWKDAEIIPTAMREEPSVEVYQPTKKNMKPAWWNLHRMEEHREKIIELKEQGAPWKFIQNMTGLHDVSTDALSKNYPFLKEGRK